jgi:16S rRNA (cytidine1402-2'-O)-methyltransferase
LTWGRFHGLSDEPNEMSNTKKGILYLIPSSLGESPVERSFPPYNLQIIRQLDHFIVEELRTARRFLRKAGKEGNLDDSAFMVFNEHSDRADLSSYLEPLLNGNDAGLLSEAGIPCVADPGSEIVLLAVKSGIRIVPLTGPSSIFLALMASGFNGQNFAFNGYLPIEKQARAKRLRELEIMAWQKDQTQIFIEVPYRNTQLLQAITEVCRPETLICIATDLTTNEEKIVTMPVREWKNHPPDFNKKPTVFLLYR